MNGDGINNKVCFGKPETINRFLPGISFNIYM